MTTLSDPTGAQVRSIRAAKTRRRIERLVDDVRAGGGIVRTATMHARGHSRHITALALEQGRLDRPRIGWLSAPGADALLVAAAQGGVVLTCITAAKHLGLWVLEHDRPHVAAPQHAGGLGVRRAHVHWAQPMVPRNRDELVDPITNVLAIVAQCRPREEALAIWESALNKRLVRLEELRRLPLGPAGRALCEIVTPWSDAGTESILIERLRWLKLPLRPQIHVAGRPVDLLIGDRLVIQVDGATHTGAQRDADNAHDAVLIAMGYVVIRIGYRQLVDDWPAAQDRIMRVIAQGRHRAARRN